MKEEVSPAFLFELIGELLAENKLLRLKNIALQKAALVVKDSEVVDSKTQKTDKE